LTGDPRVDAGTNAHASTVYALDETPRYGDRVREQEFWDLIDEARGAAGGDMNRLAGHIRNRLAELPAADIEDYDRFWDAAMDAAYRWPVWDAAVVWLGWVGDDSFRDFRGWLISRGRITFEKVIADPDTLADEPDDRENPFAEVWDNLIYDVYQQKTGREIPAPPATGLRDPEGARIDVKDAAAVALAFPRLAALTKPEPEPTKWAPPADAVPQHCPRCAAVMSAITMGRMQRDAAGEWEHAEREFRRCEACRGIAWRWKGEVDWRPAPDDPMQHHMFDAANRRT
jgi:hypothetical protein